ncbi:BES1/BZR1-like protein 4-like [Iris pallida]|uniref:Protein BZR1 homolog n=1 Tax=Iris pallida TaxID=29817 RepID=A0AAX6FVX8_IRIPA|nr:BES1/BZR1-like protein 4-like [Iris pallida]
MTSGAAGGGGGGSGRMPTWKERENNKRRERRRRAIAAKIYSGLRMYGNYSLPKHCDNNEVLKALCDEAGWTVEPDGTTYRKGCKPVETMEVVGGSASASPCSSYQPSPCASYNPSPAASSFPSPASSSYVTNVNRSNNNITGVHDANSLIPWLKNLSSTSSSSASSSKHHNLYIHTGSISAPVTPPLSSPTARTPRIKTDWDDPNAQPSWPPGAHYTFLPSSTPASPGRHVIPEPGWLAGIQIPNGSPKSPTFSLVSRNPFGFYKGGIASEASSRMWTPGQSGMSSPVMHGGLDSGDVQMMDCASAEFAFGSSSNDNLPAEGGLVKPWEGERIHEECVSDELELTLGSSRTRADA